MKDFKVYIFGMLLLALTISCSSDDPEPVSTLDAVSIEIVNQGGTPLTANSCIDPNAGYAVAIQTVLEGTGETQTKRVEYTFNGMQFSMTFTQATTQSNPITLIEGVNTVQIVDSGASDSVTILEPSEFEVVE